MEVRWEVALVLLMVVRLWVGVLPVDPQRELCLADSREEEEEP